jgi:hypothetical protein
MTFIEYLVSKKIDAEKFGSSEPSVFKEWQNTFEQMHPKSFTAQKLYLINAKRRQFPINQL